MAFYHHGGDYWDVRFIMCNHDCEVFCICSFLSLFSYFSSSIDLFPTKLSIRQESCDWWIMTIDPKNESYNKVPELICLTMEVLLMQQTHYG